MSDTTEMITEAGTLYGFFSETKFAPEHRRQVRRLVQLIPGQGCGIWLDRKGDTCIFCRLPAGTRYAVLGPGHEDHFEPWTVDPTDYATMIDHSIEKSPDVESIIFFNGGSIFADREIPKSTRLHLYKRFAEHPCARELMVESRPGLIKPDMLAEVEDTIGDKTLKVAIGLESMDESVRNRILKKFIGQKSFLRSLEILQDHGHKTFVYVFLGAPGLSERASYEDAKASIKALTELGVDEIALSCAFIPPGGRLETLYNAGEFRPPWLWTITRLIKDAKANNWPLSVGGFEDFPPPVAISQNCGRCDAAVLGDIDRFRRTGEFESTATCDCKAVWQGEFGGD
ncbi:MAG: radical SAM protein [Pseudomonadota bacterium]